MKKLAIIRYNSDVTTSNARISLEQNLFSFLLEGMKSVQYGGTKKTITPNQFFLLTAGNCLMSEKNTAPNGRYRSILFFFDNALLTDFFVRHPMQVSSANDLQADEPFLVFEKDNFLINFIESLSLILDSGQSLSQEIQNVKLEELLIYISGRYPEIIKRLHHSNYHTDKDLFIRRVVTANIYSSTTVDELAFICNMSLSTFKRHFAKIYGTSPSRWFLDMRMQKAAQLLKERSMTSSEIYLELGYENLSSFIQAFKQFYETTPKQYQLKFLNQ